MKQKLRHEIHEIIMSEIKIEKEVPLPSGNRKIRRFGKWVGLFRNMVVGDSFIAPAMSLSSIYASCKRNGWKVKIRVQPDSFRSKERFVRVWLLKVISKKI